MQSLLASFGDIKDPRAGGGDSFCDRLNCSFTVYLLILFSVIVTTRVYVGDQVSCWCPSHFTDSHVEYTNKVSQSNYNSKTDVYVCDSMSRFRLFRANLLLRETKLLQNSHTLEYHPPQFLGKAPTFHYDLLLVICVDTTTMFIPNNVYGYHV